MFWEFLYLLGKIQIFRQREGALPILTEIHIDLRSHLEKTWDFFSKIEGVTASF